MFPASSASIGGFGTHAFASASSSTFLNGATHNAFSNCDNAQGRGSRIAVYRQTTTEDGKENITSISAMTPYKTKNHEELRWEDYNFTGNKGGLGLTSSAVNSTSQGTAKTNIFGPAFPSLTTGTPSWNYTGPTFNSFTSKPLPFSHSATSYFPTVTTAPSNSFSPFSTSTPTNAFSPFTTSTPTNTFSPFTTSTPTNAFSPFTTSTSTNAFSPFTTSNPTNTFSPFTTSNPTNTFSPFTTSTSTNAFSPFTTSNPTNTFSPFTPSNPTNTFSPFTTSTSTTAFSPFTTSTATNAFSPVTTSNPTNAFSPFTTSTPTNAFSPFTTSNPTNTFSPFTTSNPTNAFSPFTTSTPTNAFSPFTTSTPTNAFSPFTTSTPTNAFSPFTTSTPTNAFSPFKLPTSTTASSVSFAPFNNNLFTNTSTSPATHTSSLYNTFPPSATTVTSAPLNSFAPSPTFNAFTNCSWSTSTGGSFISTVTSATNSISVSPVSSGLSSTTNQPTTFFNYNPYLPSTQNSNGTTPWTIGQNSISQMSPSQITSIEKPSSVASPFGVLPPSPRVFFESKQPIQYGISSIPVKDKPSPVKYSLLTTRHLSGRIKLPVRKYDPKSNAQKIPYFSDTKEIPDSAYVPRENPRALVIGPEKWPQTPTRENIHGDKFSSSACENAKDDTANEEPLSSTILDVPAKLQQPDYYTQPQITELEAKERAEPGYCRHVKDFVVGRHGYGSIKFLGETDMRNVDIETDIQFNNREVIVYMDGSKKPPVGEGLNKPAEITLLNIKWFDKKTGMQHTDGSKVIKYTEMLKKKAVAQGAEFVSYDPVEGEWKFRVKHF